MDRLERLSHYFRRQPERVSAATTVPVDVEKSAAGASNTERRPFGDEVEDVFPPTPPSDPSRRQVAEDQLRAFRHLIGITHDRTLFHHAPKSNGPVPASAGAHGVRAAPNLGLYARVVHNEQTAKKSYLWYSLLINGALGIQIIVAATLTALGAAGADNKAVTAFGAINTVIAGFLTYLKGSGLPSRLKYYQNEWKRLREYIEQRERDFSRAVHGAGPVPPDAELHAEVAHIEQMYLETKTDIEVNTPDGYTSVTKAASSQNRPGLPPMGGHQPTASTLHAPQPAHLASTGSLQRGSGGGLSEFSGFAGKLQGALGQLEKRLPHGQHHDEKGTGGGGGGGTFDNLAKDLDHLLPAGLTEKLHRLSARVEGDVHSVTDRAAKAGTTAANVAASGVATAERAVDGAERAAHATEDDIARHTQDVARDLEAHERAVKEARRRVENLVGRVTKDIHDGASGS